LSVGAGLLDGVGLEAGTLVALLGNLPIAIAVLGLNRYAINMLSLMGLGFAKDRCLQTTQAVFNPKFLEPENRDCIWDAFRKSFGSR
jgi:hypothetical protein